MTEVMLEVGCGVIWENNLEAQTKTTNHSCLKILLYGFILFIIAVVAWIGFVRYKALQEQKQVKTFIGDIVKSVSQDTQFYRDNSDKDEVIQLQNNRSLMSDNCTISIIDYTWGTYEALVLFDNKTKIKVNVSFRNNKPFLSHFRRLNK